MAYTAFLAEKSLVIVLISFYKKIKNAFFPSDFILCRRGCQPPWHSHPSVRLPPCRNLTEMRSWFDHFGRGWDDYERASFSPLEAMHKTGCPLPCTSTTFT